MIVKETRIKVSSGHKALAAHVLRGKKNEVLLVREGLTYGLRHIAFNPEQTMTDAELSGFTDRLCEELGADKASRALILHQKDDKRQGHLICDSLPTVVIGWMTNEAPGFFDVEERLARLSGLGDQLEAFSRTVDFEVFRPDLD